MLGDDLFWTSHPRDFDLGNEWSVGRCGIYSGVVKGDLRDRTGHDGMGFTGKVYGKWGMYRIYYVILYIWRVFLPSKDPSIDTLYCAGTSGDMLASGRLIGEWQQVPSWLCWDLAAWFVLVLRWLTIFRRKNPPFGGSGLQYLLVFGRPVWQIQDNIYHVSWFMYTCIYT